MPANPTVHPRSAETSAGRGATADRRRSSNGGVRATADWATRADNRVRATADRGTRSRNSNGRVRPAAEPVPWSGAGIEVARGAVDSGRIDDALRLLHIDLLERGADPQELGSWLWGAHWFPHLNYDERILALADPLPAAWKTGTRCDPQILLQFPHVGPEPPITFHLDEEPEWAGGHRYRRIVGVALSPWRVDNGALLIGSESDPTPVELDAGDAVMLGPDVRHSGGINRTGQIRYGVYFRWLDDSAPGTDPAPGGAARSTASSSA